ncbi:MAG: maleylpyruvate isomerase N-terminal domain-containing protein [Nocardioidaceae bacterium]
MGDWQKRQQDFGDAADWLLRIVGHVGGRWAEPALGEWDVRSLVGHTSRALLTVESYLAQPPEAIEVHSAAHYYHRARELADVPGVAERGVAAGAALGDDPAAAVVAIADRVVPLVLASTGDELLTSIVGGIRLTDYLPTRTFELVVHTCDLAAALGIPVVPPPGPAADALGLLVEIAAAEPESAGDLLLALTGRRPLPPGFSLL